MSCVLRCYGKNFDVDSFLKEVKIKPIIIYHKGEIMKLGNRKLSFSGFNCNISNASLNKLQQQIKDAEKFIKKNWGKLKKMSVYPKIDKIIMDFCINKRSTGMQCDLFNCKLLLMLGELNIDLTLSQFEK